VYLAGLRIPDENVRELITLVDEPTRSLLARSLALGAEVVALTAEDRERLLWTLDDVRTDALAELRAVLLSEHESRRREGLVYSAASLRPGRNPKIGPAAYFLLRGEGNKRTQTGPAWSASLLDHRHLPGTPTTSGSRIEDGS
jgi:hypothetical protein